MVNEWYVHSCELSLMILVTKACAPHIHFSAAHSYHIRFAWQLDKVKAYALFFAILYMVHMNHMVELVNES